MTFIIKRALDEKYLKLNSMSLKDIIGNANPLLWVDNLDDAREFSNMKAAIDVIHIILNGKPGEYSIIRLI